MMKKKNMAIAMAAVTVASSVAPAFAELKEENTYVISNDQSAKLVSKVRELLKVKYTDGGDAVYTISAKYNDGKKDENEDIKTSADLVRILGAAKGNVVVKIVDNGHAKDGDKIVDEAIKKYEDNKAVMALADKVKDLDGVVSAKYDANKQETVIKLGATEALAKSVTIKAGSEELKVQDGQLYLRYNKKEMTGDKFKEALEALSNVANADAATQDDKTKAQKKLDDVKELLTPALKFDLSKSSLTPQQKADFNTTKSNINKAIETSQVEINKDPFVAATVATEVNKVITAAKNNDEFKIVNEEAIIAGVDNLVKAGLQKIGETEYQVTVSSEKITTTKASTLFDGLMLTDKGNELLETANKGIKKDNKDYNKVTVTTPGDVIKKDKDKYELNIKFVLKTQDDANEMSFTVKVEDTKEKNLEKLQAIFTQAGEGNPVAGPEAYKLAGDNRYKTAVEISEASYPKASADNKAVVLVGADAIVDGLAAAPLAKELKAPVLLTGKDSLRTEVEKEIKRLLVDDTKVSELKDKTVYLVGGENVIGKSVEAQLSKMGITVERISGLNREETSLAVAEKLEKVNVGSIAKAFVVGGQGEADAMSIAALAAEKGNPIIVSKNANTLTKETKKFLDEKAVDIIGGESVVSAKVEAELADMKINVNRVKGQNRQETNANVIKKYYSNGVTHVYVAKDGAHGKTDQLIDALSVAPLAAKAGNVGPIVLATNGLSDDQVDAVELKASAGAKLVQVGHGVVETVVNKIAAIVGLK